MAIIFEGKSRCPLCGKILEHGQEYVMFPFFIANVLDPIHVFSDEGLHAECLDRHPLKIKAIRFSELYSKNIPRQHLAVCAVDGLPIHEPKDVLSFIALTSDEGEPLYRYNFIVINRKNLGKWKDRADFIREASRYIEEGKWKGVTDFNYLQNLIDIVNVKP